MNPDFSQKFSGLTILIPIYNWDVRKLVKSLIKQCKKTKIPFEIVCFDDFSKPKYKAKNNELRNLFGVNYTELKENLGRARIRNWLVKSASYDILLFLDCDSKIIKKDFISSYVKAYEQNSVIIGGRSYNKKPPKAKSKLLHWKYGSKYESASLKQRRRYPYAYFHTNNFMCERAILVKHAFNEDIVGYGYEDLVMGKNLFDHNIDLIHIDNAIEHMGLETAKQFILKSKQATDNLIKLNAKGIILRTNLERKALSLKDWKLDGLFLKWYGSRLSKIEENLHSSNPSLIKFQMSKLYNYLLSTK